MTDAKNTPTTVNRPPRKEQAGELAQTAKLSEAERPNGSSCLVLASEDFGTNPRVGDTLDGCRLVAILGTGGSGQAFLASQETLGGRPIVLKITKDTSRHEDLNLARLQHTNIMPLYWASELPNEGLRLLAMPYLARTTLARLLFRLSASEPVNWNGARVCELLEEDQQTMPMRIAVQEHAAESLKRDSWVNFVVRIGQSVAEAVAYAHQRGLVHLDLKPSNILITPDGQPIVLDLDVARQPIVAGTLSVPWLGGTWVYMSPEQRTAIESLTDAEPIPCTVDGRSDLYSLGLVLYEALGGVVANDITPHPQSLPLLNPRVSPGLADIIARCLAPNPAQRYPNGIALAEDLRRHLHDLPLVGVPNRTSERWRKWRRRRPMGLMMGMLFAGLCVTSAMSGFTLHQQNEERLRQAEVALHEGAEYRQLGQHEVAIGRFLAGKELAERSYGAEPLRIELSRRLRQTQRLQLADELNKVVVQMRFYALQENTPRRLQWVLEGAGRKTWAERELLTDRSAGQFDRTVENNIRVRLQELVILWIDLHLRLAPPSQLEQAKAEARAMVAEAERTCGPSFGLMLAREQLGEAQAVQSRPRAAWEFCTLARLALNRGDAEAAKRFTRSALELEPLGFVANFYSGVFSLRQKKYEEAARAFSFCVGQNPCAECFVLRGQANVALGEHELALQDFNNALELNPELGVAYLHRGNLHQQMGREQEAARDLASAKRLGE